MEFIGLARQRYQSEMEEDDVDDVMLIQTSEDIGYILMVENVYTTHRSPFQTTYVAEFTMHERAAHIRALCQVDQCLRWDPKRTVSAVQAAAINDTPTSPSCPNVTLETYMHNILKDVYGNVDMWFADPMGEIAQEMVDVLVPTLDVPRVYVGGTIAAKIMWDMEGLVPQVFKGEQVAKIQRRWRHKRNMERLRAGLQRLQVCAEISILPGLGWRFYQARDSFESNQNRQ
jgi:hypothetical protein